MFVIFKTKYKFSCIISRHVYNVSIPDSSNVYIQLFISKSKVIPLNAMEFQNVICYFKMSLKFYIHLPRLMKIKINLDQNSRPTDQDAKAGPVVYETSVHSLRIFR